MELNSKANFNPQVPNQQQQQSTRQWAVPSTIQKRGAFQFLTLDNQKIGYITEEQMKIVFSAANLSERTSSHIWYESEKYCFVRYLNSPSDAIF